MVFDLDRRRMLLATIAGTATAGFQGTAGAQNVIGIGEQRLKRDEEAAGPYKKPKTDAPLKDGVVARGTRNIAAAWFSGAVDRYRHFTLGAPHEPETLVVSTSERRVYKLTLGKDAVFEDRTPRLADLDGDGRDEIVVVKSYLKRGAAVAVVSLKNLETGPQIVAESAPPEIPFLWVNPAGIADFAGRGRPQIAVVRQPHRLGELDLLEIRGEKLVPILTVSGVSNHVGGSTHLALSAAGDFNGDGTPDLALPSFDRRQIRFFSFKGGRVDEFHRATLPAPAMEDFRTIEKAGRLAVEVGLAGGRKHVVTP